MAQAVTMTEMRARLSALSRRLREHPEEGVVAVTDRGKPALAVLSWEQYEGLRETMEILADPELMAALRRGEKDIEEGRTFSTDEVVKELGL